MKNRSVPADIVLPHVSYQNVVEACDWLSHAFGFSEVYRHGNPVSGLQMVLGQAYLMLHRSGEGCLNPAQLGYGTQMLTIFVEDLDAHFKRAKEAGARIVEDLHETCYGERQYGVEDIEGHRWLFSQHALDIDPAEWGATVRRKP
ncbi:MAG: VOC family protein [Terracidiphilus sp.]|jgi:uncharacterized glyoxalase superfamily protein PhnB